MTSITQFTFRIACKVRQTSLVREPLGPDQHCTVAMGRLQAMSHVNCFLTSKTNTVSSRNSQITFNIYVNLDQFDIVYAI